MKYLFKKNYIEIKSRQRDDMLVLGSNLYELYYMNE